MCQDYPIHLHECIKPAMLRRAEKSLNHNGSKMHPYIFMSHHNQRQYQKNPALSML
ncbi:hypothetical protein OIDMADRAFT_16884, partial [Oidiodendron maius Zn]